MSSHASIIPLLLAGGKGTRIAHLRPDLPKPALPVFGRPFLCWILEQLHAVGIERAVVSAGHLAATLEEEVSQYIPSGMQLRWVSEESPLGTAGGAAFAIRESGWTCDRWLVMNGDSYLGGDWPSKIGSTDGAVLCARQVDDVTRYGGLLVRDDRLECFKEKGAGGAGLINAGIYVLPQEWILEVPEGNFISMEQELFPRWIQEGRTISVIKEDAPFIDIGTPESLAEADHFFEELMKLSSV